MRIAIAADHNGVQLKSHLVDWLVGQGHLVDDRGTHGTEAVDYPPLCARLCAEVTAGRAERGIVLGGSGAGEQIACNKVRGIRAGLCHCLFTARISAAHNNANVLVMGAKIVAPGLAEMITDTWLTTPFKGGRHQERIDQITALERGDTP